MASAQQLEEEGANAVFIMTTAQYPFGKFIEISQEVKNNLKPETTLIANVGDQSLSNAIKIKDAGFDGVYHALRLREGIDTAIDPNAAEKASVIFRKPG